VAEQTVCSLRLAAAAIRLWLRLLQYFSLYGLQLQQSKQLQQCRLVASRTRQKRRPETDGAPCGPCGRSVRGGFGSRVGAGGGIGHSAVGADETGERLRLRAGRAFRWVGGPRSKAGRRAPEPSQLALLSTASARGPRQRRQAGRVNNGFLVRYRSLLIGWPPERSRVVNETPKG
jgi:hypothetical protein